jgi:hypothetical protein
VIPVTLTLLEFDLAQHVSAQRNRDGIRARADSAKFGNAADTLAVHLRGALGEIAAAKALGRYWTGAGTDFHRDQDVGQFQVRVTDRDSGCLIVRPNEGHDNDPWILVTGSFPNYIVRGWLYGHEARQPEFLQAPNGRPPAYFVPQDRLRRIDER